MLREARVVSENGRLMAEIIRSEACAQCGACQHGRQTRRLYPLPDGDYREGDFVEIELPDGGALPASLIAYGVPLAALIAGLAIGSLIGLSEIGQAALALGATAAGYGLIRLLDKRLNKDGRFNPKVAGCPAKDGRNT